MEVGCQVIWSRLWVYPNSFGGACWAVTILLTCSELSSCTASSSTSCSAPITEFWANYLHHADLSKNTRNMTHHADLIEGQALYQVQITAWKNANPMKLWGGNKYAPYLLTPGTLPVSTGEFYTCASRHPPGTAHLCEEVGSLNTSQKPLRGIDKNVYTLSEVGWCMIVNQISNNRLLIKECGGSKFEKTTWNLITMTVAVAIMNESLSQEPSAGSRLLDISIR